MKPKKIWANFSVKDAKRTNEFYTKLGFTPSKQNNYPKLASYLFGDSDFVIHFFEEGSQIDKYLTPGSKTSSEIIFTLSAETEASSVGRAAETPLARHYRPFRFRPNPDPLACALCHVDGGE